MVLSVIPRIVPEVCVDVIVWFADAVFVIRVPVVGKVTLVAAVVVRVNEKAPDVIKTSAKITFFPFVKVSVSVGEVPPKPMEWAFKAVLSATVKVFPSAIVRVDPVAGVVSVTLLKVVAVIGALTVTNPPVPLFGERTIFPVVPPPIVRVWFFTD